MRLQRDVNLFPTKTTSAREISATVLFAKVKTIVTNPAVLFLPWILKFKSKLVFRQNILHAKCTPIVGDLSCLKGACGVTILSSILDHCCLLLEIH